MNGLLGIDVAIDFPEDVEQAAVHIGLVLRTPVSQEMIELLQRRFVIAPVTLESDGKIFFGMGVVEAQRARVVRCGCVVNRSGAGKKKR